MTAAPHPMEGRLVEALRRYGAVHAALMRAFADHLALHPTDATALAEILAAEDRGAPLSPADVAARLGLSRPAISAVLHRLTDAGMIDRQPNPRDGRRVRLVAAGRVGGAIASFFLPQSAAMAGLLGHYDRDELTSFAALLDGISEALDQTLPK